MPIQKTFRGLNRFLGLYNQGQLAFDVAGAIIPTLEMDDWLQPHEWTYKTFSLAALGNHDTVAVPDNRAWRLKFGSVRVDPAAGDSMSCDLQITRPVGGVDLRIPVCPRVNAAWSDATNLQERGYGVQLQGITLNPGDRVGVVLSSAAGVGPYTGAYYFEYQEIDI